MMKGPRGRCLMTTGFLWLMAAGVAAPDLAADPPTPPAASDKPRAAGPEQIWEGALSVGAGLRLRVVVHVRKAADGTLSATLDSPDQGARGLKIDTITLDKEKLSFEMKALFARYEGKLNGDGTEAAGNWSQAGNGLPLTLKKTAKATEVRRPQTPKAPFPYKVIDVTYANKAGGINLAGTLTEPQGTGPFPAVILISGSARRIVTRRSSSTSRSWSWPTCWRVGESPCSAWTTAAWAARAAIPWPRPATTSPATCSPASLT